MKVKPFKSNVIVIELDRQRTTSGGIIIPGTVRETGKLGRVIHVGEGTRDTNGVLWAPEASVGDVVLYQPGAGVECDDEVRELLGVERGENVRVLNDTNTWMGFSE